MAGRNIHGFHDLEAAGPSSSNTGYARPAGASYYPGPGGSVMYGVSDSGVNVSMMRSPPTPDDPNGESLRNRCCPRWNYKSFTFIISVIQVVMFFITLIVGGAKCDGAVVSSNKVLGPSGATLFLVGAKYEPAIYNGHIWRLFTAALLHGGFIHIFGNLFFQLRFGFSWEARWTWQRVVAVYAIGAFGASMLSCVGAPESISVGSSGSLAALIGADLTYLAVNWALIPDRQYELGMMCCLIVLEILLGLSSQVDNWAHGGGIITGLLIAGWLFENPSQPGRTERTEKAIKWGSVAATLGWVLMLVLLLWVGNPWPLGNEFNPNPATYACNT